MPVERNFVFIVQNSFFCYNEEKGFVNIPNRNKINLQINLNMKKNKNIASVELPSEYGEFDSRNFKKGEFVEGRVTYVGDDYVLADIGGRSEGIVTGKHLKLDGKRVELAVGDKIMFYVLNPESPEGLISLSIRKTGQEIKWLKLQKAKDNNQSIKVKVVEANAGGVLAEIFEGIRGFIPSSQLNNSRIFTTQIYSNKSDAQRNLQLKLLELIGEEIEVKISEINKAMNKVILSERMLNTIDVEKKNETLAKLKIGDRLIGEVTGVAPFGLFVYAEGVEGLVHLSEISWDKVVNPADHYKIGERVEVEVIGLYDNRKKVAYSIKRTQPDPWKSVVSNFKIGQVVKGVVSNIVDYGVFVRLEQGLNGLIHISELSNKLVRHPSSVVTLGQEVDVTIISISNEERHLGLSLKKSESQDEVNHDEQPKNKISSNDKVNVTKTREGREMEGLEELIKTNEGVQEASE